MEKIHFDSIAEKDFIFNSNTFELLRTTLIENLGLKKAKRFLLRFGMELGKEKSLQLNKYTQDMTELLNRIALQHIELGHISNITFQKNPYRPNSINDDPVTPGIWHDSFEVGQHLQHFGFSNECSCYVLSGFASGALSIIHNEDIFVKELTCRAKGDAECTFEVNSRKHWEKLGIDLSIYDDNKIIDEFDLTYDKLIEQSKLLNTVNHFHSKISENIANKNDINSLLQTSYEILSRPVFITNTQGNLLYQSGINLPVNYLHTNFKVHLSNHSHIQMIKNSSYKIILKPIFSNDQIFSYCFFLYEKSELIGETDYLFLERLAVASSLCFLKEKMSLEADERLKINFLDRLIYNHFQSSAELNFHSNYIEPKLFKPYRTFSIKLSNKSNTLFSEDIYQILLRLSNLLKSYNLSALLALKNDTIIMLLYNLEKDTVALNTLKQVFKDLELIYKNISMHTGCSRLFKQLDEFSTSLYEAEKAMNSTINSSITHYEELGLFTTLLENIDPATIIKAAHQELGELLNSSEKNKELLYTLYIYLKNNRKLEKTMQNLSLSVGGIKYRISKIEKILNKDLSNSTTISHILLLIETLILLDELSFENFID